MKNNLNVPICILPHGENLPLPKYETLHSAGMDLAAAVSEPIVLEAGARIVIPTGISCALSVGYEAQIRSRSGLSAKHGVVVLNAPGTIDADYRGEIKVILINLGQSSFTIEPGMRIAQLVIAEYVQISWNKVPDLEEHISERGTAGFGSTGL
ncbi:MAG: dUTP diphosphatase [Alphaproteobacteria bacterium]